MNLEKEITNRYEISEVIGVGQFSQVFKAVDKKSKIIYALKIYDKAKIQKELIEEYLEEIDKNKNEVKDSIRNEAEIMRICKSENVVELYDYFETDNSIIFVLEFCDYNLQQYYLKKKELDIATIQKIFNDLNKAIKILHQNKLIHRDIKLENIFIKLKEDSDFVVKLGDFGCSIISNFESKLSTHVGTLNYMAPEILNGELYNYKCDLYSLGICLYVLIFKDFPFKGGTEYKIFKQMAQFKTTILKKTGIESLDNLLRGLIEISPEKRISMDEYLNHPFFKEDLKQLNNFAIQKEKEKDLVFDKKKEEKNPQHKIIQEINNCAPKIPDIMGISNAFAKSIESLQNKDLKMVKIANILYYDENIEKHLDDIHKDSDYFERKTPGTFLLCTNILSLNFVMEEIKYYNESHPRALFNLIVTGSKFQKVMDFLKDKYENYFQNICIYCMNIEKYSNLSKKYNKIKGVYKDTNQVIKFIEEVSSEKTKPFEIVKIVSYFDYKDKYYDRHEQISKFYGNLTKEAYIKYSQKMEELINSKEEKDLRIEKKKLIKSFETFDLTKDLENLHKLVIYEYTRNTYYSNLNKWLSTCNNKAYEIISYYTARLMYALNDYALKSNLFYKKNKILYRGTKATYIALLPYERLKGKIILFSAFTSISEEKSVAIFFSSREKIKELYEAKKYFSVIFTIKNYFKDNCISCGIDIQSISEYGKEKEILFQPFSFYFVRNVKFDYEKYTVDIDLEIIPKKEIFEEKIRKGGKVIYDKETNLMVIEEKEKGNKKEIEKEMKINEKKKDNDNKSCNII